MLTFSLSGRCLQQLVKLQRQIETISANNRKRLASAAQRHAAKIRRRYVQKVKEAQLRRAAAKLNSKRIIESKKMKEKQQRLEGVTDGTGLIRQVFSSEDDKGLESGYADDEERKQPELLEDEEKGVSSASLGSESSSTTSSSSSSSSDSESEKEIEGSSVLSTDEVRRRAPSDASSISGGFEGMDNRIQLSFDGLFEAGVEFSGDQLPRSDRTPAPDIEDLDEMVNAEEDVVSETSRGGKRRRRRRRAYRDDKAPFVLEVGECVGSNETLWYRSSLRSQFLAFIVFSLR